MDFDQKNTQSQQKVRCTVIPPFFSKFHWSLGLTIRLGLIKEATKATAEAATCAGAAGFLTASEETPKAAGRSG